MTSATLPPDEGGVSHRARVCVLASQCSFLSIPAGIFLRGLAPFLGRLIQVWLEVCCQDRHRLSRFMGLGPAWLPPHFLTLYHLTTKVACSSSLSSWQSSFSSSYHELSILKFHNQGYLFVFVFFSVLFPLA